MLAGLETHALAILLLKGLELCQLEGVELLVTKHLRCHHDLTLGQLNKLRLLLRRILELSNRTHRLVHRAARAVTRLEATLLLAHGSLLILTLVLVVRLAPVSLEVARTRPSVAGLASSPLVIRLAGRRLRGLGELETTRSAAGNGTTVTTNGHRLASTMTTSTNVASPLEAESLGCRRSASCRLVI